ncbi:MAG: S9 family peptidase [Acidobacteria bacterium]|nr:S9 family peptidase [Acidobacteriota bacterium]
MRRWLRAGLAIVVCVGVAPVLMSHAQQKPTAGRALTIEDYYRIQTVGSPSLAPAGKWVSYSVSTRIEDDNSTRSETWVVPTDGSAPPRRLLHYGRDIASVRWTDDDRLAYAADRQEWTVDPQTPDVPPIKVAPSRPARGSSGRGGRGGAAGAGDGQQAASVPSPDGRWLASLLDAPLAKREAAVSTEFERRHEERFKGVTFDWKDFQRDGQPFPAPNLRARPAAHIVVAPAAGGDEKTLTTLDVRPSGLAWHPDGTRLVFLADSDWRDELKYESPDLWTVTVDGAVTRLTDDGFVYSDPKYSPDGTYLSYVRDPGTDLIIKQKLNHGGPSDLYVRPSSGGDPINLTANWDLEPGATRWSPDSRFIYFTAAIGGENHLFRVSVPAGRVEQVTKGPRRIGGLTFDKAMTRIAYTVGVHEAPLEVYVANIDGTGERRLTDVHKAIVAEIALSRAERLRWPSADGTEIEGWLMFPYGYDPKKGPYPLIVVSHGGPHAATGYNFDFKHQYFAANGYFVFDTNFRSSTGYGEAFKWATWGAWGDKDGQDVVSGIDYVLAHYPVDRKRVGHTGHSYGGFMTNWLITQYPDRFAAAITGAGITNWVSDYGTADIYRTKETEFFGTPWDPAARDRMIKQSPLTYAGAVKTPTLFIHGEVDQRVPYEEGEQMYFALRRQGVPARMIQYAGQPHGISGHWNNVHRMLNELKWWQTYLK